MMRGSPAIAPTIDTVALSSTHIGRGFGDSRMTDAKAAPAPTSANTTPTIMLLDGAERRSMAAPAAIRTSLSAAVCSASFPARYDQALSWASALIFSHS